MLAYKTRIQLRNAFRNAGDDKKELYRLLKVAENLGLEWGTREIYGGGIEVSLQDGYDNIFTFETQANKYNKNANEFGGIYWNEEYFHKDFEPSYILEYNEETLAEIRNEEALYGYEMPRFRVIQGGRKGA
jgi:hypothetical protein